MGFAPDDEQWIHLVIRSYWFRFQPCQWLEKIWGHGNREFRVDIPTVGRSAIITRRNELAKLNYCSNTEKWAVDTKPNSREIYILENKIDFIFSEFAYPDNGFEVFRCLHFLTYDDDDRPKLEDLMFTTFVPNTNKHPRNIERVLAITELLYSSGQQNDVSFCFQQILHLSG